MSRYSDDALVTATIVLTLDGRGSITVDLRGSDRDGERSSILDDDEVIEVSNLLTRLMDSRAVGSDAL